MQSSDDKIRTEAFSTFFKMLEVFPKEFLEQKGLKLIEGMNKDKINEIRMIFAWNMAKMASNLPFNFFNSKLLPIFIKNLKSKNRFIREDSLAALGKVINALISKESHEMAVIFSNDSNIFKLIDSFFNLCSLIKKFSTYSKKNLVRENFKYLVGVLRI